MKRALLRGTAASGAGFVATALIGIARNKALAVTVGTSGFGAVALLVSMMGSLGALVGWLSGAGLIRHVARERAAGRSAEESVRSIATLQLLAGVLVGAAFAIAAPRLVGAVWRQEGLPKWLLIIPALALPFHLFSGLQAAVMKGRKQLSALALMSALGAAASVLMLVPLVWRWGAVGAAVHVLVEAIAVALVSALVVRRSAPETRWSPTRSIDWMMVRSVGGFSAVVQVSALVVSWAMLFVRARLVQIGGLELAGLFQAALSLVTYGMTIRNAMSTYAFAHFAERRDDRSTVSDLNETVRMSVLLTTPVVAAVLVFAPTLVELLLSAEFRPVARYALPMMVVVWISSQSAFLSQSLLASGRILPSVLLEVAWAALFIVLVMVLTKRFGLAGAVAAYVTSYAVVWPIVSLIARRSMGYRASRTNLLLAATSLGLLVLADLCSVGPPLARGTMILLICAWALAALSRSERLVLGRSIIQFVAGVSAWVGRSSPH